MGILLLGGVVFSGCKKEGLVQASTDKEVNEMIRKIELEVESMSNVIERAVSKPVNANNPMDIVGLNHNSALDIVGVNYRTAINSNPFEAECFGDGTTRACYSTEDIIFGLSIDALRRIDGNPTRFTIEQAKEFYANVTSALVNEQAGAAYINRLRNYATINNSERLLLISFVNQVKNIDDVNVFVETCKIYENNILSSGVKGLNKSMVLTFITTAKYSFWYWEIQLNQLPDAKWDLDDISDEAITRAKPKWLIGLVDAGGAILGYISGSNTFPSNQPVNESGVALGVGAGVTCSAAYATRGQ